MADDVQIAETAEAPDATPTEPAPPIYDRFLFVNVSAMRAKQLRRGALPRLGYDAEDASAPLKAERTAMEEVRRGLVHYDLPPAKVKTTEAQA